MKDQTQSLLINILSETPESCGRRLWIVDENFRSDMLIEPVPKTNLEIVSNRYDTWLTLKDHGYSVILNDYALTDLGLFDEIVYRVCKEKLQAHHCINQALRSLTQSGRLVLVGGKQDGIKSIAKNIEKTWQCSARAKKHGTAYSVEVHRPDEKLLSTQALDDADYPQLREVTDNGIQFWSKPGVFGWEKVDEGSRMLVETLPTVCKYIKSVDSIIDLGCGWGYLMMSTVFLGEARRVATDNNVTALLAAEKNFTQQNLAVQCVADDCAASIRERFDLILCNPPFHQGFSRGEGMTQKFLSAAARLSRRSTRAVFVVNQFIPLETLAAEHFSQIRLLSWENGFKVFELRP
ncbi:methyltransferase [Pseudohongiella spirulinae]|uniref:Uncharacterized protein n=1 Tax=Pseudohongiella spirulinae TaxID=1249552 RepID=A0A0S2KI40_9GAMM|nr:methyltransferase [Pseudohongiella spirulinae]ALO47631.1 hypothetical protein PS2015_3006 [Pseudohongiella spirulinae]